MLILAAFNHYQLLLSRQVGGSNSEQAVGDISDLYIHVDERMRFRVPSGLLEFGDIVTREQFLETFSKSITDFATRLDAHGRVEDAYNMTITMATLVSDGTGATTDEDVAPEHQIIESMTRVRMTVYKHGSGQKLAAVVRFNPPEPPSLLELELEQLARGLVDDLRGSILVTGPTHSGKTQTMASMMMHINQREQGHIVTFEDPVEIPIPPAKCVVSQLEVGIDTPSFASGVNGCLRQSPIAVMVGEIRDSQTAQAALRVVQGGHFLLAGMHGPDAVGALQAFCSFLDPSRLEQERYQYAQRLNGVVYQTLVRSKDAKRYWVACEVISFLNAPALRQRVAKGDFDSLTAALKACEPGTISLNASLARLVKENKVSFEDAKKASYDSAGLHQLCGKTQRS